MTEKQQTTGSWCPSWRERLRWQIAKVWMSRWLGVGIFRCECCGALSELEWESSRTQYHWDGIGADPNRNVLLCRPCAHEHHANWDAQWDEYYGGLL